MKQKLTDLIFHLDELSDKEIIELKDHYFNYSRDCGGCINCNLKYHIIEVYQIHKMQHIHNRRNNIYDRIAEDFVEVKYDNIKR